MANESRRLVISGLVQGVGFRYSMQREAQRLDVAGWVRNRRDGNVEANICGEPESLARLIAWAQDGPPGARVDHVAVEIGEPTSATFAQKPTV